MGKIFLQFKSEIRYLPLMLGKVLGGLLAVICFPTAIVILTRKANQTFADILFPALLGGFGVLLFVLSSGLLTRRLAENPAEKLPPCEQARANSLAWAILVLLSTVAAVSTYLLRFQ
jgi:hypothetical protein